MMQHPHHRGEVMQGSQQHHFLHDFNSKNDLKPSVVLLEARQACSGATGRNGLEYLNSNIKNPQITMSHVALLDPGSTPTSLLSSKSPALKQKQNLHFFDHDHVDAIAELVKKYNIDCDFTLAKSFDIFNEKEMAKAAKKSYLDLKEKRIAKITIDDPTWTSQDMAEEVSGVKRCLGCFEYTAPISDLTSCSHNSCRSPCLKV